MKELVRIYDKSFVPFLSNQQIQKRLKELCATVNKDYADKRPLFLAILNGAFVMAADVMSYIRIECEISFIKLKSYQGMQSTGEVVTMLGLDTPLKDRHVVILEDIVDSGQTLHNLLPVLDAEKPASVKIFSLLLKPDALAYPLEVDYLGFEIPNDFVVGYGLDFDGLGRNLNDIYKAK